MRPARPPVVALVVALAVALLGVFAAPATPVSATSASPAAPVEEACGPVPAGHARCLALRRTDVAATPNGASGQAALPAASPAGYHPADLRSAYSLPSGTAGAGLTVAIVDAYDLASAEADLAVYRAQFGLPECTTASGCFRRVDQSGGTNYPASAVGTGWDTEIELDLNMVSAVCPNCSILLVEANSNETADLAGAVDTAVALGAIAVSNSYSSSEEAGQTSLDVHFNHPGVAITAASGDSGYADGARYPASSPYVVAVGGTTLRADASARGWSETAWSGSGSGCSAYEPKPFWQTDGACSRRAVVDVAAVANPATGVAVYDPGHGGWVVLGGTSVGTPIIAAAYALAGGPVEGAYAARSLYAGRAALWDVSSGANGSCDGNYLCTAGAGFDGPTGLGTPNGTAAFTAVSSAGATYVPLTPNRLVDSRSGTRLGLSASLISGTPVSFQVTDRVPGDATRNVPATAVAVTGNLTAVNETSHGYFALTPAAPSGEPQTSTLNFPKGDIRANSVTVSLGSGGQLWVTFWGLSGAHADVVFDVTGYFSAEAGGATYVPLTPNRLVDSRSGTRLGLSASLISGTPVSFQVTDRVPGDATRNVPATAVAVTGNLTAVNETSHGYFALTPAAPSGEPQTSTLNFPKGDIRANGVTVSLGSGGQMWVTFWGLSGAHADVVFDVTGYFSVEAGGATYVPLTPNRLVDSRSGTRLGLSASLISGTPVSFQVTDRVPGDPTRNVPATAVAVTGNLTAVNETSHGYFALTPAAPSGEPQTSTLNFPKGDIRANGVTVSLGSGSQLWVTFWGLSGAHADVVFDVTGYFE